MDGAPARVGLVGNSRSNGKNNCKGKGKGKGSDGFDQWLCGVEATKL
jgi:hypothetical protein